MAIINGTVWLLALGGTDLPDQTEGSISVNMDMIDITTKDSSGVRELLPGLRSGSISVSGLVDDQGTGGAGGVLFTALNSQTVQTIVFGLDSTNDYHYTCSGYCSSLEVSGSTEDNVTYSATFEITGGINQVTA